MATRFSVVWFVILLQPSVAQEQQSAVAVETQEQAICGGANQPGVDSSSDSDRQDAGVAPRLRLAEIKKLRLPDVRITSTVHHEGNARRAAGQVQVAHVDVEGIIGGTIQFELLLPDEWNSRFVMGGGGGFVGRVSNFARSSINQGYATVGTDTGRQFRFGAGWALDNVEAQVNYGYLAVHRTAEVAKAIIYAYYGLDPKYSYFSGCSTGGGQALIEAQRPLALRIAVSTTE